MNKQDGKGIKALSALGLIITTIIWGSGFVVMKNSVEVVTPAYLLALRFTIASVALVAVFWKAFFCYKTNEEMAPGSRTMW